MGTLVHGDKEDDFLAAPILNFTKYLQSEFLGSVFLDYIYILLVGKLKKPKKIRHPPLRKIEKVLKIPTPKISL